MSEFAIRTRTGVQSDGRRFRAITEVMAYKHGAIVKQDRYEGEWRDTEAEAEAERAEVRRMLNTVVPS